MSLQQEQIKEDNYCTVLKKLYLLSDPRGLKTKCSYMYCDGVFKLLRSPGNRFRQDMDPVGRYDNPIHTRLLAPIDCSEIPALECCFIDLG